MREEGLWALKGGSQGSAERRRVLQISIGIPAASRELADSAPGLALALLSPYGPAISFRS